MTLQTDDGVTEGCTLCGLLDSRCCREECALGKSGRVYSERRQNIRLRPGGQRGARFREKLLFLLFAKPYLKTDTGGRVGKTKVNG